MRECVRRLVDPGHPPRACQGEVCCAAVPAHPRHALVRRHRDVRPPRDPRRRHREPRGRRPGTRATARPAQADRKRADAPLPAAARRGLSTGPACFAAGLVSRAHRLRHPSQGGVALIGGARARRGDHPASPSAIRVSCPGSHSTERHFLPHSTPAFAGEGDARGDVVLVDASPRTRPRRLAPRRAPRRRQSCRPGLRPWFPVAHRSSPISHRRHTVPAM